MIKIPSNKSVESILKDYFRDRSNEQESEKHLNDFVNGLVKYFNTMLGSQLLYKFERLQYTEVIFCYCFHDNQGIVFKFNF